MSEHVIIQKDRTVVVPESQRKIGIQYDHNVKTITFDCPRYPEENPSIDMSTMSIYINYMLADKTVGASAATNVVIDETDPSIMHFDWKIKKPVTYVRGNLFSLVCIKQVDDNGDEIYHWNTDLFQKFFVGEGMECIEEIEDVNVDLITHLLSRMDVVEDLANPITMQQYVSEYLNNDPELQETVSNSVYNYLINKDGTNSDNMTEYVSKYFDNHPPLFVIGSDKPGVKSIWFDTNDNSGNTDDVVTLNIASDSVTEGIYAEVEDETNSVTNISVEYGG